MMFLFFLMNFACGMYTMHAGESGVLDSRCGHGAQFISLCTNKPVSSTTSACTTNFSLGVDLFLQDIIITVSTSEIGSPVLINLSVTNTLTAPTACATDITTDELRVVDNLGATYFSNLYDYEVLRANRSIFPTFGNENILTSTDASNGNRFGISIALSGDASTMVIGAPGAVVIPGNTFGGALYIFQKQVTSWAQVLEVPDPGSAINDFFGSQVAISEDQSTVVVTGNNGGVPTAYVYNYDPFANQLSLLQTIQGFTGSLFDIHIAVSATGQYIVLMEGSTVPQAFVYVRQNVACSLGTTWTLQQTLVTQAGFGPSVAISADGTVIALGVSVLVAPANQGIVYLYTNDSYSNTSNAWSFRQTVVSSDIAANDLFGVALALSSNGKYLLVGASGKAPNGKAYEFVRRGRTWLQENTFLPTGGGSSFGISIGISGDGTVGLFGAGVSGSVGNAYIDFRSPDNTWRQPFVFTGHANGAFGNAVAISADGAFTAVGAPNPTNATPGNVSMFSPIGSLISSDAIITGSLCVYGQTNVNGDLFVTGSIFTNGFVVAGAVAPCTPSDYRIKKNVQPLMFERAWSQLKKLRPVTFTWKNPELHKDEGLRPGGFIAQEVAEHYPHWIRYLAPTGADAACIPPGELALHLAITPEILAYIIAVIQQLHVDDEHQRDILHKRIIETLPASSEGVCA